MGRVLEAQRHWTEQIEVGRERRIQEVGTCFHPAHVLIDLFSPPTQAPFWCGNIATCDLSREGGELCTSDQAPEKAGLS